MSRNTCSLSFIVLLYVLLFFSPNFGALKNGIKVLSPVSARPIPVGSNSENYVSFEIKKNHEDENGSQLGHGVENCLPKGFRRTSAPSRYTNYQTLSSTLCSTSEKKNKP
ncbi:hypothetical protein ACH5RR_016325 [Cinchona calisaya]|uniref:Transmembrane protein n=1 Tax=Cinchona calisaya TaxID=153742 RepID=A0ABD2ZVM9_9GENT